MSKFNVGAISEIFIIDREVAPLAVHLLVLAVLLSEMMHLGTVKSRIYVRLHIGSSKKNRSFQNGFQNLLKN